MALLQCQMRGIEPGPISTYPGWKAKGRQVKRGEKAIVLCMPLTSKRKVEEEDDEAAVFMRFIYRANWFVLCQTEGEPIEILTTPDWDRSKALSTLSIIEVPFEHMDGNCMGYARRREIAISPLNQMPHKTTFHELAHVLLGHTSEVEQIKSSSSNLYRPLQALLASVSPLGQNRHSIDKGLSGQDSAHI